MYLLHEFTASTKSEQKISKYVSVQNIQSVDVVYKIFQKFFGVARAQIRSRIWARYTSIGGGSP